MLEGLRPFLAPFITAALIAGLSWLLSRSKPAVENESGGMIRPERWTALFTVIGGALMCIGGVAALVLSDHKWAGAGLAVMGAAAGGFMAPSLTSVHAVRWKDDHVEGPSKMFGPTLGLLRATIAWSDIATTGKTLTGYWYVQSRDGRRVYWSYLYKGHGALAAALRRHCPSLTIPDA
jgi:hypothetical protein